MTREHAGKAEDDLVDAVRGGIALEGRAHVRVEQRANRGRRRGEAARDLGGVALERVVGSVFLAAPAAVRARPAGASARKRSASVALDEGVDVARPQVRTARSGAG